MSGAPVETNRVEVESYYVRERHAMFVRGDLGGIFEDHYLHLMQLELRLEPEQDEMLKDALAALTLHLMARPRAEMTAWTLNFREPPLNLFVTGDSEVGNVIGRVFTEDVKVSEANLFFAQVSHPRTPSRQSTVEVTGRDVLAVVEQYYRQSEQLPARYFRLGGDAYAMLVAQPDVDMPWFKGLDVERALRLEQNEELQLLERRPYHFACGCNLGTVLRVLVRALGPDPEAVFAGDPELRVKCPRCAGVFVVDPPTFATFVEQERAPRREPPAA